MPVHGKPILRRLLILALSLSPWTAQADIYKCSDAAGHITYTNDKPPAGRKDCSVLTRDAPVSTVPAPKRSAATPTPNSFPRISDADQKNRDGDRRKILEEELAAEEASLATARKALTEQEAIRNGDERNYQKLLDRLQPFKEKTELHERNIEAIRKEISRLR